MAKDKQNSNAEDETRSDTETVAEEPSAGQAVKGDADGDNFGDDPSGEAGVEVGHLKVKASTLILLVSLLPIGGLLIVMIVFLGASLQMKESADSQSIAANLDAIRITTVLLGGVTLVVTGVSLINISLINLEIGKDPAPKNRVKMLTPVAGALAAVVGAALLAAALTKDTSFNVPKADVGLENQSRDQPKYLSPSKGDEGSQGS